MLPGALVAITGNGRTKAQQIIVYPARSEAREPSSFYFSSSMGRNLISLVMISSWSEKAMIYYYLSKPATDSFSLPSVEGEPSLVYEFVSFFAPSFT